MARRGPLRGPDPSFPVLSYQERIEFPKASTVPGDEPALWGANLSPGVLLSAYSQGYFPWYSQGEPLWWWSPDPRFGLRPSEAHVGATMAKVLRQKKFDIRCDSAFEEVMTMCSRVERPGQDGTWITQEMIRAYCQLFDLGLAHSIEAWQGGDLVGGLYGIQVGALFAGESMFSLVPNASKAAFLHLCRFLEEDGYIHLDSQVHTSHVESLGGRNIARQDYLEILSKALQKPMDVKSWTGRYLPAW